MPFIYASEIDSPATAEVFRSAKRIELLDTTTHQATPIVEDKTLPAINFGKSRELPPAVLVVVDFSNPDKVAKATAAIERAKFAK